MPMGFGSFGTSRKQKNVLVNDGGSRNGPGQGLFNNQLTALVVDDNRVNRRIHRALLASLGVNTQEAENGQEAVDVIRGGAGFDLVLMDMEMPVMDGPQATRLLRAMGYRNKIVGVSGNSRSKDKVDFMNAGIDAFYVKPITRSDLIALLQEINSA